MTLKEYGRILRLELIENKSTQKIESIANQINNATINGKRLTANQKSELMMYISNDYTDDGKLIIRESDNSQWLKTMGVLKELLIDSDKNDVNEEEK